MDLIPFPALLLAGLAIGVACALPIVAWGRWRRGEPARRVLLSSGLLGWVALQLSIGLMLFDVTWPLTGYPMYAPPIPAGSTVDVLLLAGTTRAGQEVVIPGNTIFEDQLDLQARVMTPLRDPETRTAAAAAMFHTYNANQRDAQQRLVELRGAVEYRRLGVDRSVERRVEPLFSYALREP